MRPEGSGRAPERGSGRVLLGLASVAVAFAAADTYVVELALPDMMTSVGVEVVQLQKAAPIVSGFLLGYVAMLPLIGRIADLRGRLPVLVMALVVFALGSLELVDAQADRAHHVGQREHDDVGVRGREGNGDGCEAEQQPRRAARSGARLRRCSWARVRHDAQPITWQER